MVIPRIDAARAAEPRARRTSRARSGPATSRARTPRSASRSCARIEAAETRRCGRARRRRLGEDRRRRPRDARQRAQRARRPLRVCMVHYSDYHLDSRIQRQARALAERGRRGAPRLPRARPATQRGRRTARSACTTSACEQAASAAPARYVRGYGRLPRAAVRRRGHAARPRGAARPRRGPQHARRPDRLPRSCPRAARHAGRPRRPRHVPGAVRDQVRHPPSHRLRPRAARSRSASARALADHVITVTEEARRRLAVARRRPRGRSSVVMNSPDERVFGPPRAPVGAARPTGPCASSTTAAPRPRFGVETLIRAFGLLDGDAPRVELRVCGSGEDRAALAALAAEIAPERIDVAAAPVPVRADPGRARAAHIGVVPTLHDAFTELLLPVKLLEYVHMGLPRRQLAPARDPAATSTTSPCGSSRRAPPRPSPRRSGRSASTPPRRASALSRRRAGSTPIGWEQQQAQLPGADRHPGRAHIARVPQKSSAAPAVS